MLALFLSCRGGSDKVEIGVNRHYCLDKGEKKLELTSLVKSRYSFLVDSLGAEIPLNRFVKSNRYQVFIGVVMNNNVKILNDKIVADRTVEVLDEKLVNGYKSYFLKKKDIYYFSLIVEDDYPLLILTQGKDSTEAKKLYDGNKIVNKVI